ncbi:MAG: hypothetical protein SPI77_01425 [Corynebacterium sp.]|nr:hypothetical protein [Corynebacterium sp.]
MDGTIVYRDENGELHREDGPAIEYDDGYKEYWHHGVEIPEDRLGKGPASDDGVLVFDEEIG